MIRTKTVFVIGAGASCELGFPPGSGLLEQIRAALDIRNEGSVPVGGEQGIRSGLRQIAEESETEYQFALSELIQAAERIRGAAVWGQSIDNLINQHSHDPLFAKCAKLAIAHRILQCEFQSPLGLADDEGVPQPDHLNGSWLPRFLQILVQGLERDSVDQIFDNVDIICFNYDRTIRHFLPYGLKTQFGLPMAQARDLAGKLTIWHPYGSLGPLPWEGKEGAVPFGDPGGEHICAAANSIRTFTERIEDEAPLAAIQDSFCQATKIVFLGFGFLQPNMELLRDGREGSAREIFGTTLGQSGYHHDMIRKDLTIMFDPASHFPREAELRPVRCKNFLEEFFLALSR